MSSAVKAIKKPIKKVLSKVEDEILKPVVDTVEGVVKAMGDDPITTIAMMLKAVTLKM